MIDRQHGKIQFCCDACGEVFETEAGEFEPAWKAAKDQGWRAKKIGSEWCHACPDCEL